MNGGFFPLSGYHQKLSLLLGWIYQMDGSENESFFAAVTTGTMGCCSVAVAQTLKVNVKVT